jgi:hypothetical protein
MTSEHNDYDSMLYGCQKVMTQILTPGCLIVRGDSDVLL